MLSPRSYPHYCMMVQKRYYNQRPFDETMCDAINANNAIKTSKKMQNVCDGRDIKHDSYQSCMCDAWHTVPSNELFAMRKNNRNGQPEEGVCDIRHTVHSYELFALRKHNRNGKPYQVCAIYGIRFTRTNYFLLGNTTETVQFSKMCVICSIQFTQMNCLQ